jgi:REP element-mobilizing transposase RayT
MHLLTKNNKSNCPLIQRTSSIVKEICNRNNFNIREHEANYLRESQSPIVHFSFGGHIIIAVNIRKSILKKTNKLSFKRSIFETSAVVEEG